MSMRLADRLRLARRRQFVGRDTERSLFRQALEAEDLPFSVLFLYGAGGIGKTTLVHELASIAEEYRAAVVSIDCRSLQPTQEGFVQAVRELAAPIDSWIRDEFLPPLPANALVVIAGRAAPSIGWRTSGTHRNALLNIPASGRRINVTGVSIMTIRDGLVCRSNRIWDVAGFLRSVDLLPELAAVPEPASTC